MRTCGNRQQQGKRMFFTALVFKFEFIWFWMVWREREESA
jgi:hypothetical protein